MRDLLARHEIIVNPSGRFPSERLRPDGSLNTGTPAEARDLAMTTLRWWCLTILPGARLQIRLWRQMNRLLNQSGTGQEHKVSVSSSSYYYY